MKTLLIGGTGTISAAITQQLADHHHEVYLLNRGTHNDALPANVHILQADIRDEAAAAKAVAGHSFDVVAEFIAFDPDHVALDHRLFHGRTRQYIFISSASAYQKPLSDYRVAEGTPLANPFWEYSRNKIACEEFLVQKYRETGFPITIVRPSHTYDERSVPLAVHGSRGSWQVVRRIIDGKPVVIHGDGTSLWTITHASDFARGFIGLMGNLHAIGESVQITSDETVTWNQVYEAIASAVGAELRAVHVASEFLDAVSDQDFRGGLIGDKANSVVFDNSKLKRLVPGFVATVRADQGIRQAIKYILEHPEYQQEDPDFDAWCDGVIAVLEQAKMAMRR